MRNEQSSRAVPETGVVEELRANAGCVENGGCVDHSMTDEASLLRRAADALEAKDRELAEARERCQMWFDTHDAHRKACDAFGKANGELMKRAMDAERRATTAERERDEAMAALREKEEAHLSGLASDIAREIEAHDLFDCPGGTTYVRAAQAIADRLVERFGRASTLSTQNIGKNVSEDGQPVSGSREQRGNEEG